MPQISGLLSAFKMPVTLAGDLSFLLLFVGLSLAFGFVVGRWKLVNILINVYIALAFVGVFPREYLAFSVYAKAGLFLVLVALLTVLDKRLFDVHISNAGTDFFWRLLVMSLLVTGMIVSVTLSFLPKAAALGVISRTAYGYFASATALSFWLVVPLVALLFINNRLK